MKPSTLNSTNRTHKYTAIPASLSYSCLDYQHVNLYVVAFRKQPSTSNNKTHKYTAIPASVSYTCLDYQHVNVYAVVLCVVVFRNKSWTWKNS